jgi:hypothetical protein
MICLKATKNQLVAENRELLTAGSVGVNEVSFSFSDDWDGLTRTAVFKAGDVVIQVVLDDDNACNVPWEVLATAHVALYVGVYGSSGALMVLPTVWAALGVVRPGTELGEDAKEPTPDVYQQILADIEAGKLRGPQGEPGADGKTPEKGIDYWTAEDQEAIVQNVLERLESAEEVSW